MADRSLVVDANILLRAILGRRVAELIERYAPEVGLFAPDVAFLDVEEHMGALVRKRGLALNKAEVSYEKLCGLVQELPAPAYKDFEAAARARIEKVDPDDWPVIACALTMDCGIWTEDRDFFGIGIPTWTTERIGLFFADIGKPTLEVEHAEDK